jgi:adenine phosphoribosyltransferase
MRSPEHDRLRSAIRDIPDFPKPGILFKDITPVLADPALFSSTIDLLCLGCRESGATKVVGLDARGFIFGAAVASRLGLGFVPVRKKGKLPYKTIFREYGLEYGDAAFEVHVDGVLPDERVILVDDLLATGGSAEAALGLMKELGADVAGFHFVVELSFLGGRERLGGIPVSSLIAYRE